ncbi:hypothetical protein LL06_17675 [Hoeflea sp. BAL378]|uniref:hypothetical protein n=1 Tax=Hoeflea sp. BAL378 TaxID=1547437 RepID=UPI00051488C9|nr:hypothetical protein [Hoeflea sp. BAL378]KGF68270.1 hypothetical protein LL06_17675 [Hoeflea sp. BAL378]
MKKIALISFASVLALGAAAIAADEDVSLRFASLNEFVSTPAASSVVVSKGDRLRSQTAGMSRIRIISPTVVIADTCRAANWPYYPQECLETAETAEL